MKDRLVRGRRIIISTLTIAGIILGVNLLLSTYVWVPRAGVSYAFLPLFETLALLWLLFLGRRLTSSGRLQRIGTIALGAALGFLAMFAAAEAFFRYYYARPFMPRGDIGMVRGALLLFFGDIGSTADVLTPITVLVIIAAVTAIGAAVLFGAVRLARRVAAPLTGLAVVTVIAVPMSFGIGLPESLARMSVMSWFEHDEFELVQITDGTNADGEAADTADYSFPGLLDRDIYMFAVEAYGYAAFHRDGVAAELAPYRDRLAAALRTRGYEVRTSFFESPVAGGYSWLAEATLLTGQWIDSQERFEQLYNADLPSLSGMLQREGYYTVTFRPGTVHGSWPEGWDLYRFEEAVVAHDGDFAYEGPWFSYVPITDQFTLWTGERRIQELTADSGAAADRPLLAYYQLVSSHTPYNKIPPIIEDWEQLGNGDVYNRRSDEIRTFDNTWTGGSELKEGYVAAVGYVLTVLRDYVTDIMNDDRDPIIIIFGDHQPQPPIRGPQGIRSVPVHVASKDPVVLENFAERGFEPGMEGGSTPPHRKMSSFFPMLAELARSPVEPPRGAEIVEHGSRRAGYGPE